MNLTACGRRGKDGQHLSVQLVMFWGVCREKHTHKNKQSKDRWNLKEQRFRFSCPGVHIRTHGIVFGRWEFHSKVNLCLDCQG